MKTLGLIGGTTWLSTIDYYRIINQLVNERLGGLHSANLLLRSVDFHELKKLVDTQSWPEIGKYLSELAIQLENAGADCIVLCANTMHMVADMVQQNIRIPLIHIAEATANEILKQRIQKVGLLGTRFTMEQPFFTDILSHKNIQTFIPNEEQRMFIHTSIFDELGKNIFKEATKYTYLGIIENLRKQGAEGIIFGCTEIPMLIKAEECSIPVFDTTFIYATAAVEFAQQKPL